MTDQDVPPGFSDNPSAWSERLPSIGLALVGFGIAMYLTLYQLGVFKNVWEPFFGDGSRVILHSSISRLLPIPDAALGAVGYLLDALTGSIGGRERWRTMPWIVLSFGLVVGLLGVVSIMLVIFQPLLSGAWCTLCLASAMISLTLPFLVKDEVRAGIRCIMRERERGRSVWHALRGCK